VLTLVCDDRLGIVHGVSGFLTARECNIVDSQQFSDAATGRFFMRMLFDSPDQNAMASNLRSDFAAVADRFSMDWQIHEQESRCRTLVMVSRFGHCLNDLLYRWQSGALSADVCAVISNHRDLEPLASAYGLPFHHLPATTDNRAAREQSLRELIASYDVELVVLARYMQVLSDDLCRELSGRVINIHHSFLPSFKGAKPHQQAFDHGVKLIGATAHYVTPDLDEGPIIDQEVARVDHTFSVDRLASVGRDVEALALSRAVQWHAEHRVLLNGAKTVVFR
jgi:formyltetrahydrofolate deformylase